MEAEMSEVLKRYFLQIAGMVEGISAIIITDKEGVPVLKVSKGNAPELAMKPRFLATTAMTMDQAGKLGVSLNKSIVTMYKNYQVVSLNKHPFIVNIIASSEANTGMILSLEADMQDALEDIRTAVEGS